MILLKALSLYEERRALIQNRSFISRLLSDPLENARDLLLSTHRDAMAWYLSKKLKETSDLQRDQQEVRLMREVERSKR